MRTTTTKKATTTDEKVDALKPGGSIEISRYGNTRVIAERSGNGKRLRIVREYLEGSALAGQRVQVFDIVIDQVW